MGASSTDPWGTSSTGYGSVYDPVLRSAANSGSNEPRDESMRVPMRGMAMRASLAQPWRFPQAFSQVVTQAQPTNILRPHVADEHTPGTLRQEGQMLRGLLASEVSYPDQEHSQGGRASPDELPPPTEAEVQQVQQPLPMEPRRSDELPNDRAGGKPPVGWYRDHRALHMKTHKAETGGQVGTSSSSKPDSD
ncbi:hypothetical protein MRX96_043477 [Rhipicephalus microplus]